MPAGPRATVVDAVTRSVEIQPIEGADAVDVRTTLRTVLAVSPADVWRELTEPARLAQWYGPVVVEPATDGEGLAYQAPGGATGRVLRADAPHALDLSWQPGAASDRLELRLDPEDDGSTCASLAHRAAMPTEIFDRFGPGATAVGWDIALLGLVARTDGWREMRLAAPTPTPMWLASAEGADHVRAWSIRWAAASIAAGTDEQAARRAETETSRAYGAPVR